MEWEFLGNQQMPLVVKQKKAYVYTVAMWRCAVPGGWLVTCLNSNSNDPNPATNFYPDPDHDWQPNEPPEAQYLLRPATSSPATPPSNLLRAAPDGDP